MKAGRVLIPLLVTIGLILASNTLGQKKTVQKPVQKVPSIFISLESVEIMKDSLRRKDEKRVWLRLRNNSRWTIKVDASGGVKGQDDASLYYDILDDKDNIKQRRACHVCSIVGLARGKSILFAVPYEELEKAASLRIQFSYPWEDEVEVAPAIEPTHFVYFYIRDLEQVQLSPTSKSQITKGRSN